MTRRWARALLVLIWPGAVALDACSSSSPIAAPPACPDGSVATGCTPGSPDGAADASDATSGETSADGGGDANSDAADSQEAAAEAGDASADADAASDDALDEQPPPSPPTFAGVVAVAPASSTQLLVVWNAGSDAVTPASALTYRVYAGKAPLSFANPLVTPPGAEDAVVGGLETNTTYEVAVRAVNGAGLADTNTVELAGIPKADTTPPTFAGLKSAAPNGPGEVVLGWDAAQDNLTPGAAISYAVYVGDTPGSENFASPTLVTSPGAVTATVNHLPFASQERYFVVRAQDASGNLDSNTLERSSTPGADVTPPVFGGCTMATNVLGIAIQVQWTAAVDNVSLPSNIAYDIFESTVSDHYDFTQPFTTVVGQTSVSLAPLAPFSQFLFVCRARDEAGNEDANTTQVTATTMGMPAPPSFDGINGFQPDPVARTVTISWVAGMDSQTPPFDLVYEVYEATTPGGENFDGPPLASTPPGATSITVQDLPAGTTLYFVVRAQDLDGEQDSNTIERSFTTNLSFALNVQPIFTQNCGVVGCHVPGNPTGGLILAPGFAYGATVGVPAGEGTSLPVDGGTASYSYVSPGSPLTSFLNLKINAGLLANLQATTTKSVGSVMPAPGTGTTLTQGELDTIASWITQGALNN